MTRREELVARIVELKQALHGGAIRHRHLEGLKIRIELRGLYLGLAAVEEAEAARAPEPDRSHTGAGSELEVLRDRFAMAALTGLLARNEPWVSDRIADQAWAIADVMMAARRGGDE